VVLEPAIARHGLAKLQRAAGQHRQVSLLLSGFPFDQVLGGQEKLMIMKGFSTYIRLLFAGLLRLASGGEFESQQTVGIAPTCRPQ